MLLSEQLFLMRNENKLKMSDIAAENGQLCRCRKSCLSNFALIRENVARNWNHISETVQVEGRGTGFSELLLNSYSM